MTRNPSPGESLAALAAYVVAPEPESIEELRELVDGVLQGLGALGLSVQEDRAPAVGSELYELNLGTHGRHLRQVSGIGGEVDVGGGDRSRVGQDQLFDRAVAVAHDLR